MRTACVNGFFFDKDLDGRQDPISTEAVAQRCSVKKVFLKSLQNSQENTCARVSFLIKKQNAFIKKETLAQVFSCTFAKFFGTPIFKGHLS